MQLYSTYCHSYVYMLLFVYVLCKWRCMTSKLWEARNSLSFMDVFFISQKFVFAASKEFWCYIEVLLHWFCSVSHDISSGLLWPVLAPLIMFCGNVSFYLFLARSTVLRMCFSLKWKSLKCFIILINAALEQCTISMLRGMRRTLTNEKRRSRRGRGTQRAEEEERWTEMWM